MDEPVLVHTGSVWEWGKGGGRARVRKNAKTLAPLAWASSMDDSWMPAGRGLGAHQQPEVDRSSVW